jgi:hypothetical protein
VAIELILDAAYATVRGLNFDERGIELPDPERSSLSLLPPDPFLLRFR